MSENEIFKAMKSKYRSAIGYDGDFWKNLHAIQDDIVFFKEYTDRFKKVGGFFRYDIKLSVRGLIFDFFFRGATDYLNSGCKDALQETLEIFYILMHLFNGWQDKGGETNTEVIKDIIAMDGVVRWYLGGNHYWYISAFVGCSHTHERLEREINKLQEDGHE